MAELSELREQAEKAAQDRGHRLGEWHVFHGEFQSLANNSCVNCGAEAFCNTKPQLNQTGISGAAVNEQCSEADWGRDDVNDCGYEDYEDYGGVDYEEDDSDWSPYSCDDLEDED